MKQGFRTRSGVVSWSRISNWEAGLQQGVYAVHVTYDEEAEPTGFLGLYLPSQEGALALTHEAIRQLRAEAIYSEFDLRNEALAGRGFEAALELREVPPRGYLWVSRFLWADPNEWRSEVTSTVGGQDVDAWLKTVGPEVEECEGTRPSKSDDVVKVWVEYTAALAVTTLQVADEFLEAQPTIAARVDELLLQARDVEPPTWIPGVAPKVQIFAEALRRGLAVSFTPWHLGEWSMSRWDSRSPSKTLGGFCLMLAAQCDEYVRNHEYGLFDPRLRPA